MPFADVLEQTGAHASAEQRVQDVGRVALLVRDGVRGDADADLHLLERLLVAQVDARKSLGRGRVEAVFHGLHVFKMFRYQFDEVLVVEISGGGYDQVAGSEAVSIMPRNNGPLEALYGVARSEDGFAESMVFPETLRENFVDEIVGTILVHFDFFEDDAALTGNIVGVEYGTKHEIAKNIKRDGDMLIENLDVEADAFFGGEGVHVAAD